MLGCSKTGDAHVTSQNLENYDVETIVTETSYPLLDFKEMSGLSDAIVSCKFKGYTNPFRVRPHNGGDDAIFKDANFEIIQSYKGDLSPGDIITVRTMGGEIIDHETNTIYRHTEYEDIKFNNKHEKLLFLARPTVDIYKTDEDYYKSVTGPLGVFNIIDDKLVNVSDETITHNLDALDTIDPSVDPDKLEKEQMDSNLKQGFITQEEYDTFFNEMDKYGEKIE